MACAGCAEKFPENVKTKYGTWSILTRLFRTSLNLGVNFPLLSFPQSTGAIKAALALDTFSNVTHGFAALLIGDCFEDVIVTTVNVSQKSHPLYRRVPNSDTSSTAYSDHIEAPAEIVPSAVDLTTGGVDSYQWIVTFMLVTVLSTAVCACVGLKCITGGFGAQGTAAAYANSNPEDDLDKRATRVDGTVLDTPKQSPAYTKENRMFSPRGGASAIHPRLSTKQKRTALNARSAPNFRGKGRGSTEDFEVLSSASEASSTEEPVENPMFSTPPGSAGGRGHAPRLSALDFGKTIDEDNGDSSDVASEFWRRRRHRDADDAS